MRHFMPIQPAVDVHSFGTYRVEVWFEDASQIKPDICSDFAGSGAWTQANTYAEGYETSAARVSLSEIRELSRAEKGHEKVFNDGFSETLNELRKQILAAEFRATEAGDVETMNNLRSVGYRLLNTIEVAREKGL